MKNYGDQGGCYLPWLITPSSISIILHKILSLMLNISFRHVTFFIGLLFNHCISENQRQIKLSLNYDRKLLKLEYKFLFANIMLTDEDTKQ